MYADTMEHYMGIANNIPLMEMKADRDAQAWARSARNILILTSESVAESLMLANASAQRLGTPLFCLPTNQTLNANEMNDLIQKTFHELSSQASDKNNMTVSEVALLGIRKLYPCAKSAS